MMKMSEQEISRSKTSCNSDSYYFRIFPKDPLNSEFENDDTWEGIYDEFVKLLSCYFKTK